MYGEFQPWGGDLVEGRPCVGGAVRPESLFVGSLNSQGQLTAAPQVVVSGLTYSSFDSRVARIDEQKALIAWSDTRDRVGRDIYAQIITNSGNPLLTQQGRKISNGIENIQYPPQVASDGQGGGYVAWISDSIGSYNFLRVRHFTASGELLAYTAQLLAPNGFQGEIYMVADTFGGVFVAYSEYNSDFSARIKNLFGKVAKIKTIET